MAFTALSKPDYDSLFQAEFGDDWKTMRAICMAESGLNNTAVSPDGKNIGVCQINVVHAGKVNGDINALFDPATNIRVAGIIYRASGYSPWTVYKTGAYRKYL